MSLAPRPVALTLLGLLALSFRMTAADAPAWRDQTLPVEARVNDISGG